MPPSFDAPDDAGRAGFFAILERLDATVLSEDEALSAGERYEALRRRLVRYFTWERCQDPEYCADETLTRVAAKLAEGQEILNLRAYVFGVARVVRLESATRLQREAAAIAELGRTQETVSDPQAAAEEDKPAGLCLKQCLAELSPEQRSFILRYYGGDGGDRIENRKRMADEEGVGMNALRNRALRLRDRLERCCRRCLGSAETDNAEGAP